MKKLVLLAVTAIVIAAVLFFGVKAIKATPKAEAVQELNASVTTSVSPTATPAPVTTVTPTATPKPAEATPAPTATPAPATSEEATPSDATASEATPADAAEAFIESLCDSGINAEEIPAMAREEKGGFLKSVKLGDSALTTWTALDLPLGEEPEWEIPTRAGKPIVAGWAYMTRRAATVLNVVPDWYCAEHKAARWSCQTTSEDYTLYKGDVASESLRAFRLVRTDDGTTFEWSLALCECGVTEKISGGPGGSSPTKKPTTPPTPPSENEPTEPDHPPYEGVDDADHPPKEGITGDSSEQENIGGADSDTNESHGSLEGVGGDEEPKARRSSKKSFFND